MAINMAVNSWQVTVTLNDDKQTGVVKADFYDKVGLIIFTYTRMVSFIDSTDAANFASEARGNLETFQACQNNDNTTLQNQIQALINN